MRSISFVHGRFSRASKLIFGFCFALAILCVLPQFVIAAAYDCSSDANCVAHFDFESGALTTDSAGSNTLTSNGSPDEDLLNYRQGTGSVRLNRTTSDWYSVTDANLDADFPGKVASSMSSCFWTRPMEASPSGNRYIMSKFATSPSPFIVQYTTAQKIKVFIGASTSTLEHASALTVGQWYHVCFSYDHADQSGRIHIYDDNASSTLGVDKTGTFSSAMTTDSNDKFAIGSNSTGTVNNLFEGNIDEMLIFKDVLSTGEMDTVRGGASPNPDGLSIDTPVQYQTTQRTTATTGPITISGEYVGTPTAIECSFNGGAYATVDATPSGNAWSGTLTADVGDGSLVCRFTNDTNKNITTTDVRVGDVYMVIGQSNAHGRGDNDQSYTGSNHGASQFDLDDNWEVLGDSSNFLSTSYGSVWPLLGSLINENQNVPVAFIGYAEGGTGFAANDWNQGDTVYNSAVSQFNDSGVNDIKAFLWYQGENDASAGSSAATYESALSTMLNALQGDLSTSAPLVAALIGEHDSATDSQIDAIRTGLINAWTNDSDIYAGPSAHDQNFVDNLHWTTDSEMQTLAERWYRVLSSHFYSGTESARGPQLSAAERVGLQLVNVDFTGGEGSLNDETDTEGWVVKDGGTPVSIDSVTRLDSDTVQIDTSVNLTGVVTLDYLSGGRSADAAWRDSGTYTLPPEPIVSAAVATPPLVLTLSPSDGSTGIDVDTDLVITFSESVTAQASGSNDILIKHAFDSSTIETIDIQSAAVSGSGTTTITVDISTLQNKSQYYVQIGADALNATGDSDSYGGISDNVTWNFTTVSSGGSSQSDYSPYTLPINYNIELKAPLAGVKYSTGDNVELAWSVGDTAINFVSLSYSLDGILFSKIATHIVNTGVYTWVPPEALAGDIIIRVEATDLSQVLAVDEMSLSISAEVEGDETDLEEQDEELGPSPVTGELERIDEVLPGDFIRGQSFASIYYIDVNMKRRPFIGSKVFFTWQDSFDQVKNVTDATLASLTLGAPMLPKAQVVMVKIQSDARVYVIEGENVLRWVVSEAVASELYGDNWADYIIDIEPVFFARFELGDSVDEAGAYEVEAGVKKLRSELEG